MSNRSERVEQQLLNVLLARAVLDEIPKRKLAKGLMDWRKRKGEYGGNVSDDELLHGCGSAACFGGWVAVTPAFQERGVKPGYAGNPEIGPVQDHYAVGQVLFDFQTMFSPNYSGGSDRKVIKRRLEAAFEQLVGKL